MRIMMNNYLSQCGIIIPWIWEVLDCKLWHCTSILLSKYGARFTVGFFTIFIKTLTVPLTHTLLKTEVPD